MKSLIGKVAKCKRGKLGVITHKKYLPRFDILMNGMELDLMVYLGKVKTRK